MVCGTSTELVTLLCNGTHFTVAQISRAAIRYLSQHLLSGIPKNEYALLVLDAVHMPNAVLGSASLNVHRHKSSWTTHKGRWSSSTAHQYCIWSVKTCGGGTGYFEDPGSCRRWSGSSMYHLSKRPSRNADSMWRLDTGRMA